MSDIVADLRSYLISNASPSTGDTTRDNALKSLYTYIVSDGVGRIHYARTEQNSPIPALWYEVSFRDPIQTMDGVADMYKRVIGVGVVAITASDLIAIGDAVKDALHNFQGTMGETEVSLITFDSSEQGYNVDTKTFDATLIFQAHYKP